jgi:hypothetical protein
VKSFGGIVVVENISSNENRQAELSAPIVALLDHD